MYDKQKSSFVYVSFYKSSNSFSSCKGFEFIFILLINWKVFKVHNQLPLFKDVLIMFITYLSFIMFYHEKGGSSCIKFIIV